MAINHTNCSIESCNFCDELLAALRKIDSNVFRHETANCGFATEGTNRFAYLYHKANFPLATIFLRGDDPEIIPPLSNGATVQLREKLTGSWAQEFPQFIHLPFGTPSQEVAELLMKYSLPLAKRTRKVKSSRKRVNDTEILEGEVRTVLSNRYERSRVLRAICLQHHGYKCAGCNLIMAEKYGQIADQFIHVHHVERLADTGAYTPDPTKDLIPLCPNCHSVVHLKTPPLTIEALRALMR